MLSFPSSGSGREGVHPPQASHESATSASNQIRISPNLPAATVGWRRLVRGSAVHYMMGMERRIRIGPWTGALLAVAGACKSDSNINPFYPEIVVTPDALDFGDVVAEYKSSETIDVFNAG